MTAVRNPFMDLPDAKPSGAQSQSVSPVVNPFMSLPDAPKKIEPARNLFQPLMNTPTSALMQAGQKTWENPVTRNLAEMEITSLIPPLRLTKFIPKSSNIAKGLLNYGTDILQNAGLLSGMNVLEGKSPTEGAIVGGGTTAVVNPLLQTLMSGNPLVRAGGAGVLGMLGTYGAQQMMGKDSKLTDIGGGLAAGSLALRGRNAKNLATMNLLKDVNLEEAMPKIKAAERLGLKYIRPSEAMDSGYIGGIEGAAGITPDSALFLEKQAKSRRNTENKTIRGLYDKVFQDEKQSPDVSALYKSAYQSQISPQMFNNLTNSSVMQKAINEVENNAVYKDELKGVPRNSFAYLDQVKRALGDMSTRAGYGTNEARVIVKQQKNLVKKMDEINETYKQARNLSEREIVKNKMQETINDSELKGRTFFNKLLKNDTKFEKLRFNLRNVPEAQQQLDDMRLVFKDLIDADQTARTGSKMSATSMNKPRSSGQWWDRTLQYLQGGKYDQAMVELMTNPKWYKEVERAKNMAKPNERNRYISNILSRASGKKINDIID